MARRVRRMVQVEGMHQPRPINIAQSRFVTFSLKDRFVPPVTCEASCALRLNLGTGSTLSAGFTWYSSPGGNCGSTSVRLAKDPRTRQMLIIFARRPSRT